LFLIAGLFRVVTAEMRTRSIVAICSDEAVMLNHDGLPYAAISAQRVAPLMLVGIRVPRILISQSTCDILSDRELLAAVRHEVEHLRAHDNLKKVILNFVPFPGLKELSEEWLKASELTADDGAVTNREEALDLASALIKLSRHFPHRTMPAFAASLVDGGASTTKRVERLLAWKRVPAPNPNWLGYLGLTVFATFLLVGAKLSPVLSLIHSVTERFVP